MKDIVTARLHEYLRENNPDALFALEESGEVTRYLSGKVNAVQGLLEQCEGQPEYITREVCLNELTKDLRPSKFNYIAQILCEEFENDYKQFLDSGIFQYEVINLISQCQVVFEDVGFTEENEDSNDLRNAVTGTIGEYLEKRAR